jgi:hypothetical protein
MSVPAAAARNIRNAVGNKPVLNSQEDASLLSDSDGLTRFRLLLLEAEPASLALARTA